MQTTSKMSFGFVMGAIIATTTWSSSWLNAQGASTAPAQTATKSVVTVVRVIAQTLDRPVGLPGDVVAFQDVELRARVSGFVDSIGVDRGSMVKKGAVLAQIVAPELKAQRSEADAKVQSAQSQRVEAEAKLASDEATYQRLKNAAATPGVIAVNDLDVAAKTVDADRARVETWKQNEQASRDAAASFREIESYLRITAPFDGVITERNVHVGSLVGPTTLAMLRIQQVSTLRLVVSVPEDAVAGTQIGQTVNFTVPAYPGRPFTGKVARMAHALDVKTRTMPVEVDINNASGVLAPGMFAQVAWSVRRTTPSLFVPTTAVATTTERTFVVRVRNGQVEWVDVKRGAPMKQLVEVFGSLSEGDQVAVRGTDELRPGMAVQTKLAASNQ
jgi:membrane fusion protein (multidrug efflux system)